jgi:phage repressor protein C with HTH and peptisase S24 domain
MQREHSTHPVSEEGRCWIPVNGDSMWPSLRAGDVACVEPLTGEPGPGEVVLARLADALVVHRVRRREASGYVLRGDNSDAEDPLLPPSRVLGRVRRVRRGGEVLEQGRWDRGPLRVGRWRVVVKRRLATLLGRRAA